MIMYILIDNYDSFTYNLYQYLLEVGGEEVKVFRSDRITLEEIARLGPKGIVISPGPGHPEEAGISVPLVKHFAGKIPILGVCLGHQAVGCAFGGSIRRAKNIVHGKTEEIALDGKGLFRNIPSPSRFTRYHSLVVGMEDLPAELEVTAVSADGEIMGVRHTSLVIEGIQFHPESIASEHGKKILNNFVHYRRNPFSVTSGLAKLTSGKDLSEEEAGFFMDDLTEGELSDTQTAAFLTAFSGKRPNAREIAAMAAVLIKKKKGFGFEKPLLDTCGTGGDGKETFNISSLSAIVACACGACVAKHGNRGVSSQSGSADFYRELGIPADLDPESARRLLERTGFTFLFAPLFHGSMKHAAKVRRELGIKTVMNMLGPLLNPADAGCQLIGVYAEELVRPIAESLAILGKKRAMVVHGLDGMDEISLCAPTRVAELKLGTEGGVEIEEYVIDPRELGVPLAPPSALRGGSARENALAARRVLEGLSTTGAAGPRALSPDAVPPDLSDALSAVADAACLNAGAALYLYGLARTVGEGYALAKRAVESGAAREKLNAIVSEGRRISAETKETRGAGVR
jgi:anthranilate synthase/phosphoribosyltransferase